jgi:hypothetical protein
LLTTSQTSKDDQGAGEGVVIYSDELVSALASMPGKAFLDLLIDNFLSNANYHYYPLYPPEFKTQFQGWWMARTDRRALSSELTALILQVCACSSAYLGDDETKEKLETELGETIHVFTKRMHNAAMKLSDTVPLGKGGLIQVQQLFLAAYWLKAEEKWIESRHILGDTIQAAQEIGELSSCWGRSELFAVESIPADKSQGCILTIFPRGCQNTTEK